MEKRLLLISSPADYGSTTLSNLFEEFFSSFVDTHVYVFADTFSNFPRGKSVFFKYFYRLRSSIQLWKEISKARNENYKLLFVVTTPALYAFPLLSKKDCFLVTDWTKSLYEKEVNKVYSPSWVTLVTKVVMSRIGGFFALTSKVEQNLIEKYQIGKEIITKVYPPFMIWRQENSHDIVETKTINMLFVGADPRRKGVDKLLRWIAKSQTKNFSHTIHLSIITKKEIQNDFPDLVDVVYGLTPGSTEIADIYKKSDILILPTEIDAFPMALGEAATSGLAIIASTGALGAPEIIQNGVNGYIFRTEQELNNILDDLCCDLQKIHSLKNGNLQVLNDNFDLEKQFEIFESKLWPS
jgi:glycosyltransferase involved in cell wall biosynthesis